MELQCVLFAMRASSTWNPLSAEDLYRHHRSSPRWSAMPVWTPASTVYRPAHHGYQPAFVFVLRGYRLVWRRGRAAGRLYPVPAIYV